MPSKVDPQIRVMKRDLKDLIRDEIYGAAMKKDGEKAIKGKNIICIPTSEVRKIAKRIANRAIVGH